MDESANKGNPVIATTARIVRPAGSGYGRRYRYLPFIAPSLLVIVAVVAFPWAFTIYMSMHEWQIAAAPKYIGLAGYAGLFQSERFVGAIGRTFYFTALAVVLPLIFGTFAAVIFHNEFRYRSFLRGIFIMPMMATPVAVALVWTMMFHPQMGVLNYLLSLVGIPPQLWVYEQSTVIPSLILVEVWQWTPLVMLIVIGGLAAMPTEPFESARIDGANNWQMFRYITFPLVLPFIMVAAVIRTIDGLKTFDSIFVITGGGPGVASETINIYLYLQAFAFNNLGHASVVVVFFFVLIVLFCLLLLYLRQKMLWA